MKLKHAGRYTRLFSLFTRYGLKDFTVEVDQTTIVPGDDEEQLEPDVKARAESFAKQLKEMGPAYIKFGQVLSTRRDVVPPEYIAALEEFQDDLEPFSFAEVEKIIEEELEVRLSKLFPTFDAVPIAAASLGQVHNAVLRDGREVVVKVQRPDIEEGIAEDLEALHDLAGELERHSELGRLMNIKAAVEEFRRVLSHELDYRQEATNAHALRANLADFEDIYIPTVIDDLTTRRVLVMEMVQGKKISAMSKLAMTEHDYTSLADVVTRAWMKQICIDGFWHSDPHPGNVFLSEGRVVLLDFGMVSQISSIFQDYVMRLLLALGNNRGDEVAETCLRMGEAQEGFNRNQLVRDVSSIVTETQGIDPRRFNTGQMLFRVIHVATSNKVRLPSELSMLAKTLLHLDTVTRSLDPDYNPRTAIHDYAEELTVLKLRQRLRPRNFYTALLDADRLLTEIPQRSRDILDRIATGQLGVSVRLSQIEDLLKGVHKIANRITVGLVIAALLVASVLAMRIGGGFVIAGYNGLSVIGFSIAVVAASWLMITTFASDRADRRKADRKWE